MSTRTWVLVAICVVVVPFYGYLLTKVRPVWRLLATSAVEAPREPENLLEQVARRAGSSLRAFLALFGVAVLGTAIGDFDRDVHNGLGNMVSFLMVVAGLIVLWWGVSIGWTVSRTAKAREDVADEGWLLGLVVWAYAVGIVYGLLLLAGLLGHLLHRS